MDWAEYVKRYYLGHTLPIAIMRVILEVERLHKEGKTNEEIKQEFDQNWFFTFKQLQANITLTNIQNIIDAIPEARKNAPQVKASQ